jgi:hypothetical protein
LAAHLVSPLPYDEIWAGDSTGSDPNSLLNADFIWELDVASKAQDLTYRLELDAYPQFDDPLNADAGNATKVAGAFPQGIVATELEDLGVELYDSSIMYARVVASDGANETYGPQLPLIFRRGKLSATAIDSDFGIPDRFALHANYPNPFNPTTAIRFDLPRSSSATLEIFDLLGRTVAVLTRGQLSAGRHVYRWDASRAASGLYIYRLTAGEYVAERTLVLLK